MRQAGVILVTFGYLTFSFAQPKQYSANNREITTVSNKNSLFINYKIKNIKFSDFIIDGKKYVLPTVQGTEISQRQGFPMLPVKTLIIGIPQEGTPSVKIIKQSYYDTVSANILPYQKNYKTVLSAGNKSSSNFEMKKIEKKIYSADSFYPENAVSLNGSQSIGWLRRQRIMSINLNPILFNPVENQIRVFKEIEIEIDFNNMTSANTNGLNKSGTNNDNAFETIYKSVLSNYNQARSWRKNVDIQSSTGDKTYLPKEFANIPVWYKFTVDSSGIYQITYESLVNAGIDPKNLQADQLHILNGGGRELPLDLSSPEPKLKETSTFFMDRNNNGLFDKGDALVFYATGDSGWDLDNRGREKRHYINYYTKHNVYWLAIGSGTRKKMAVRNNYPVDNEKTELVEKYRAYFYREDERLFPDYQLNSGVNWYWDNISGTQLKTYYLPLKNVMPGDTAELLVNIQGWTEVPHPVNISINGKINFSDEVEYTMDKTLDYSFVGGLLGGTNTLTIQSGNSYVSGLNLSYLDWVEVHYWSQLRAENNRLIYKTPAKQGYYDYYIRNFDADTAYVFDITDKFNAERVINLSYDKIHSVLNIVDSVGSEYSHKIIALSRADFNTIDNMEPGRNPLKGLRDTTNSADYVVIAHPSLMGQTLNQLISHLQNPHLYSDNKVPSIKVINVEDIYDEFSWGLFDPTAIRNFLKYTFYHWKKAPEYVLLVGKACYDFKNNAGNSLPDLVPTYEGTTIGTDDWFVYLTKDGYMDMIIGRLPASNPDVLNSMVQKITKYDNDPPYGVWKNSIMLTADDEYSPENNPGIEKYFTIESEELANSIVPGSFELSKVYLMNYHYKDPAGNKPAARADFIKEYNKGNLIVNFIGHGNFQQLADETLFYAPIDIKEIRNGAKLPVFIAATCGAGRFDGNTTTLTCIGERLLNMTNNGAIASIAATRWGLNTANYLIDKSFIQQVLGTTDGIRKTFGEALVIAKTTSGYTDFTRMIDLLGLPSEYINSPKGQINLTSFPDTLNEGMHFKIAGEVLQNGKVVNNYNGTSSIKVLNSDTLKTEQAVNVNYSVHGNILIDTLWNVANGLFDSTITLSGVSLQNGHSGKISVYSWGEVNGEPFDAAGAVDTIVTKSTVTSVLFRDTTGPYIYVKLNGKNISGFNGPIGFDPKFCITLSDYGSGVDLNKYYGIHLYVDDDTSKTVNLTSLYDGKSTSGEINYAVTGLAPGKHSFKITAWDVAHNESVKKFDLVVGMKDMLSKVYTYPNPASGSTSFTFYLNQEADIKIKIYTVAGRLVKYFNFFGKPGFNIFPSEPWHLRDQDGNPLANGVYFFKIIASSDKGSSADTIGKIAVIR